MNATTQLQATSLAELIEELHDPLPAHRLSAVQAVAEQGADSGAPARSAGHLHGAAFAARVGLEVGRAWRPVLPYSRSARFHCPLSCTSAFFQAASSS